MEIKTYSLIATVSTESPEAVREVLRDLVGKEGTVKEVAAEQMQSRGKGEFQVQAEIAGESAKELNRTLLSALRKVEKKTRLRAAWSSGGSIEQYFDYVLKKTTKG